MRISARLDDIYEKKFHLVQQEEGKSRTLILKEALDMYFSKKINQQAMKAQQKSQQILEIAGGIATAANNLSETYKEVLDKGLKEKYDID